MEKLIKILLSMICLTALTLYGEKQKVEQNQKIQYILEKYEDKSEEEKRKIRQAEKRLVNHVIKNYKLRNNEKINKIKVVEYKKVLMTDSWRTDAWRGIIELNDKYRIVFKDEGIGEYIYEVEETAGGFTLTNNATLSEVMEYSTKKYQMQVLAANNAAGTSVFVQSVTVGELNGGVLGAKVDEDDFKFINKFGRIHNVDPVNPGTNSDSALAIEKKVSGAGGNMSEYFPFSLKLTDPATNPSGLTIGTYKAMIVEGGAAIDPTPNGISGAAADHSFTISQGTAFTFKLKHGQKLVVLNLPVGAKYEASETDSKGHTANITVKANGVAGSESATTNVPSTYIGEAANSALVRNDKVASTPTGILMNNLPYVILIAIAIAGLAAAAGRKRLES